MKRWGLFATGILLFVSGALILAFEGATEITRIIVTPQFVFGLWMCSDGWDRAKKMGPHPKELEKGPQAELPQK